MTSSRYIRIGAPYPDCLLQDYWTTAFIDPVDGWANSYLRKQEISQRVSAGVIQHFGLREVNVGLAR